MNLTIIELLHLDTGTMYYEVVEDEDRRFSRKAIFRKRAEAEEFIKESKKKVGI